MGPPASEERSRWLAQLFSTQPADRPRAEAAALSLYRSASFEEPKYFLWFDSPLQGCQAVALLLAEHHPAWRQARATVERSARGREAHLRLSAELCRAVAEPNWAAAVAAIGRPMDPRWLRGPDLARTLQSALIAARLSVCKDPAALYAGYDEEDDLSRAEAYLWGPARGVLVTQPMPGAAQSLIAASFYTIYSYVMMASDEVLTGSAPPPPMLAAAWEIARSAGPWWPFAQAAVLTERPAEIHLNSKFLLHRADGPAALYRDGSRVYAFNGNSLPADWILNPEKIPAAQLRKRGLDFRKFAASAGSSTGRPGILTRELPRDPDARLNLLREEAGGRLPLFDSYVAGRQRQVWLELVALGSGVREEPLAADALAVAYEAMRRVEANVRTVVERLQTMGYHFHSSLPLARAAAADTASTQTRRQTPLSAHLPPGPRAWQQIQRLERRTGVLPLFLRAFYDVVGAVDLAGSHPRLPPLPRPLQVLPLEETLAEAESASRTQALLVSPAFGEESACRIAVPNPSADGELLDERHGLLFVDYLRLCFRFGGFPGFDGIPSPLPPEIAGLREGLLEF